MRIDQSERGAAAASVLLRRSAVAWFTVAAAGQGAFVWMILAHYGRKTLAGDAAGWNDKPLIMGHVAGDTAGNAMFGAHVLLAALITLAGLMQLIPAIRRAAPALHRWTGRAFFVLAYAMALGGFWLTWARGARLSAISGVAVSLDGALILIFSGIAWRLAAARRIEAHRRWATRAFLAVSAVWFLRIGMMAWAPATGGLGMNRTLSGPADIVLQFGAYLIPLAVYEAYLRAQAAAAAGPKRAAAALMLLAVLVTAAGSVGAVLFMWGPYMI